MSMIKKNHLRLNSKDFRFEISLKGEFILADGHGVSEPEKGCDPRPHEALSINLIVAMAYGRISM